MANLSRTLRRGAMLPLITNGGHHPCIMLADPIKQPGKGKATIPYVHLTSSKDRSRYDPTCLFKAGDDPLITKDCWVFYFMAQVREVAEIESEMIKRKLTARMISRAVYMRIIEGLLHSEATNPRVREYFEEALRRGFAG